MGRWGIARCWLSRRWDGWAWISSEWNFLRYFSFLLDESHIIAGSSAYESKTPTADSLTQNTQPISQPSNPNTPTSPPMLPLPRRTTLPVAPIPRRPIPRIMHITTSPPLPTKVRETKVRRPTQRAHTSVLMWVVPFARLLSCIPGRRDAAVVCVVGVLARVLVGAHV
jgi:hypothetical protein